ncbi:MAG: adenylyltransferase/cytidyltransferase family protein [Planctomycetota bacterium]|nr:adenylyltransferase/cytidyltransferase family protein [Planctomycetota bacterium]
MGEIVGNLDHLVARCGYLKTQGVRLILTNGAFDVLHVGHIRALEDARGLGDVLLVAVNDDASVRALKGPGRPVVPAAERAEIVAALKCVDFVHIFAASDVGELLRALRPDVHAKGHDYTVETVPEREIALEIGAEIVIVGDPKDHSSSGMINRMRD